MSQKTASAFNRSFIIGLVVPILILGILGGIWTLLPRWFSEPPVVESLTLSTTLDGPPLADIALQEGITTSVVAYGEVSTKAGCGALLKGAAQVEARWHYSDDVAKGITVSCTVVGCSQESALKSRYACTVPLPFFTRATDEGSLHPEVVWVVGVRGTAYGEFSEERTVTAEVLTLTAVEVPSVLQYGDINEGGISGNTPLVVRNTGNNPRTTLSIAGTDFACNAGKAPVSLLHYGFNSQEPYEARNALTKEAARVPTALPVQISTTDIVQQSLHMMVKAPRGVGDDCKNRLTLSAGS